jgi:YD repeat-containing protein
LTCPFDLTCFPNENHGCAPPWFPGIEINPPGLCGCSDDNFYYVNCWAGYGADYEKCCGECHANPDYNRPCPDDVEPPCTTCGGGGAGGSGGGPGGSPPPPTHVGLPVSLTTGAVFFTHSDARVGDREVSRSYNSDRVTNSRYGVLGAGWNASFEMRVRDLGRNSLEVRAADGSARYYQDGNADGTYEAILPPSNESWMVVVPGGGYRVVFRKGGSESYDANGRILVETDASGVETAYAYDERGRFASVSRLGRSISLAYSDNSSRPAQLVGPSGVVLATYTYDSNGALDTVRYPDGGGFRFGYQGGRVIWVTDLDGNPVERHEYDGSGRAATSEIADGRKKLTIAYGTNVTTVTDALGTVSTYEHQNVRGIRRVTKAIGPCASCGGAGGSGSGERRWIYDAGGNVTEYQNEIGDVWKYTYSSDNELLTDTNPLQQTTSYTYYADGRVNTISGPDGSLTTYTYGPAGPTSIVQKVTSTEHRTTGITYTPQGKVEDVTDPRGKVTHMAYAPQGELESVRDPLGHTTDFGYDDRGRRTTVTDALGHTTTTHYDDRDRVTTVIQHDGTHTDFAYDTRGNRTSVTDPLGRILQYVYDRYGFLEKVIGPGGGVTRYGYDLMGQLIALTDAMGNTTRFQYETAASCARSTPGPATRPRSMPTTQLVAS